MRQTINVVDLWESLDNLVREAVRAHKVNPRQALYVIKQFPKWWELKSLESIAQETRKK